MVLKRAVILKIYYMPNGLTSIIEIHQQNPPNFQGCWTWPWGKIKKGLYEYRKQPITTKLPKTTENNLEILKTTSFFHLKTVRIVPQDICPNI